MSDNEINIEQKILDYLASVGGKASGGDVKKALALEDDTFKAAKTALKDGTKIITGRGRGGTLSLTDVTPVVEAQAKEDTNERRLNNLRSAREEKKLKRSENKANRERIDEGVAAARKQFPDHEVEFHAINMSRNVIFVCVWGLDGDNQRARVLEF